MTVTMERKSLKRLLVKSRLSATTSYQIPQHTDAAGLHNSPSDENKDILCDACAEIGLKYERWFQNYRYKSMFPDGTHHQTQQYLIDAARGCVLCKIVCDGFKLQPWSHNEPGSIKLKFNESIVEFSFGLSYRVELVQQHESIASYTPWLRCYRYQVYEEKLNQEPSYIPYRRSSCDGHRKRMDSELQKESRNQYHTSY